MLVIKDISKTFNPGTITEKLALRKLSLHLKPGDFVTVIGGNGAGKSTLLRIIAGVDKQFSGTFKWGSGVSVGYFSQDSAEKITGTESVLDYMENHAPLELIPKLRDMLGAFLFHEALSIPQVICVLVIVAGIIGLKLLT